MEMWQRGAGDFFFSFGGGKESGIFYREIFLRDIIFDIGNPPTAWLVTGQHAVRRKDLGFPCAGFHEKRKELMSSIRQLPTYGKDKALHNS